MRRWLAALASVLLLVGTSVPAPASWLRPTPADMLKWAGCSATLTTSDEHSPFESMYSPERHRLYFGTKPEPGLDPDGALMILAHEISHCLQAQEGVRFAPDPDDRQDTELDADRRGADILCSVLHKDGARINHDLLVYVHERYGYDGDSGHGTLAQRIEAGYRASACHQPEHQGP